MKLLLELFSGTHSVGKVAETMGYEVVSVDKDMKATFKCDIMDWDYEQYPNKYFDVIWASPPCTEYSRALTTRERDIEGANVIVQKTLDILTYFEPKYWLIENPQTGLLKNQVIMWGLPYTDIDYCKYGMQYRKRTRIWNNVVGWVPKPLCMKDCGNIIDNKHTAHAQRGGAKHITGQHFKLCELYVVPEGLITEIFSAMRF